MFELSEDNLSPSFPPPFPFLCWLLPLLMAARRIDSAPSPPLVKGSPHTHIEVSCFFVFACNRGLFTSPLPRDSLRFSASSLPSTIAPSIFTVAFFRPKLRVLGAPLFLPLLTDVEIVSVGACHMIGLKRHWLSSLRDVLSPSSLAHVLSSCTQSQLPQVVPIQYRQPSLDNLFPTAFRFLFSLPPPFFSICGEQVLHAQRDPFFTHTPLPASPHQLLRIRHPTCPFFS